jgi:hypothetical protein
MKKQNKIEFIRREMTPERPGLVDSKVWEYFDSLDPGKDRFIDYILHAGLSIQGILKPIARRSYIQACEELIKRIYDPEIYYAVIPEQMETRSARRMILNKAHDLGMKKVKIFHAKGEFIEPINL